jgi:hypothetical protein
MIAVVVQPPSRERFDPVRTVLSELDAAGLAASAGALSLLPANGHHLWRLGALAALAAERPAGGNAVTQRRLRVLLNGGPLAAIAGAAARGLSLRCSPCVGTCAPQYMQQPASAKERGRVRRPCRRSSR